LLYKRLENLEPLREIANLCGFLFNVFKHKEGLSKR